MKRSLVLGGGGVVGVSWLVGMLTGLTEGGVDLSIGADGAPDEVIGTSAGSIVGALLAAGMRFDAMQERALDDSTQAVIEATMGKIDLMLLLECFGAWSQLPDNSPESAAKLGAIALKAPTIDEADWVESFVGNVGREWPTDVRYRCTAVNAETGEFTLWGADSGIELAPAVASSCTVPAIFPPVTINGSRWVDGGVRSASCADVAEGDHVIVLAPIGSFAGDTMDPLAAQQLADEVAQLEARGATVVWAMPDDEANAATLTSPLGRMDPASRAPAITQGIRQGAALAARLAHW